MTMTNKRALAIGAVLALTFFGVLILIFSPIFGDGKNGLVFADDMFNKLSKGSSYFIPKVAKKAEPLRGTVFTAAITLDRPELAERAAKLLAAAGAQATVTDAELAITGDLGALLGRILEDSDAMFRNNGAALKSTYGIDEKDVLVVWWNVLKGLDKAFKKQGAVELASIVSDVSKKAVEPAHNFYGIESQRVADRAGIMSGLLVFYVVYTMWWGFAIFYLFEGFGLTMKKAKIKKEV